VAKDDQFHCADILILCLSGLPRFIFMLCLIY